jgi:NADPH-dependent 2,4-dienoyl-CoA reductase/sulfur reductase-like enzyme/peroxiredoxin family protein/rhodanese-related sulfurtransferase/TusA-related sulfurtransferase
MEQRKRVLIVGGVAGGASCAARARRLSEGAEIVMFERGEYVSFANCGLPYHIGGAIADRDKLLVQTPEALNARFRIDVRVRHEVTAIDREKKQIHVRNLITGEDMIEAYDALVLSPGAEPFCPPIPGVDSDRIHTLRNMSDMDRIKKVVDGNTSGSALVIGGGYIGLEMAEALRERGMNVTLVELADQVFIAADKEMVAPVHQQLQLHGIDLRLGASVDSFVENNGSLQATLSNADTVSCDMAILAIGVRPESKLAKDAALELGGTGGILVSEKMLTSDPNIYAVGDAVQVKHLVSGAESLIPLAGPANRQGRIAADNIFGRDSAYRHTQGTAICKIFDLAIGMTGLSEKNCLSLGLDYEKVFIHPSSHASYYPGASPISLKLIFNPNDGRVLGAQAIGSDGVDKRIDVLAMAIRGGLTVRDLRDAELSYAPPFGSAKDPVNYAGFVASNVLDGDMSLCQVEDCLSPTDSQFLLDVRTPTEVASGSIPGAFNIPVDDLRARLGELPKDKELLVFCAVGLRGYLACRILSQNGYACRNLTGGYKTYKAVTAKVEVKETPTAGGACSITPPTTDKSESAAPCSCCTGETMPAIAKEIDARGLQCPGPIMQLKTAIDAVADGEAIRICASDPGFASDVEGWCNSTGNHLADMAATGGNYCATVVKHGAAPATTGAAPSTLAKNKSIVIFSGDFDKAMAGFIIANGAAAMGSKVTLFFTFWGLNILRRPESVSVKKNMIERMFGWMMPRGANKLALSNMNMGGMGLKMIKGIMKKKNVASLPELIASAQASGVRLVACTMSMDLMGIKKEELIDGVEEGGVAMYLDNAEAGNVNLFI